jgi:hypothetical protein
MTCGRATHVSILGERFMHGSIQSSVRQPILTAVACGFLIALGTVWSPNAIFSADAPAKPAEKTAVAITTPAKPVETKTPAKAADAKRAPRVSARRVEFASAMVLWFSIVLVGLGLLVMVMVLGRRLRNSVRRRPPPSTVPDPFWYLKKNPKAVAHANPAERSQDPESGSDSEGRPSP